MRTLANRRVLVTGAAGGLGRVLVARLLDCGAQVIATDVSRDALTALSDRLGGDRLQTVVVDQSDPHGAGETVRRVLETSGPVDSLINNAAIYPTAVADGVELAEMQSVLNVNAVAAAALMQAAVPGMKAAGFGRIVNVASITFALGFVELSTYVASKGALIGLTRVWAREFGPNGITVNAVSPGAFPTDAEKIHADPEKYNLFVLDRQAIKRRGKPEDFAHLVAFLLDEKSGFLTGQNIMIDGGWVMQ